MAFLVIVHFVSSLLVISLVAYLLTLVDMLITEPVVFFFSLWAAFSWAVLYLQFSSVPLVFKTNHNFNIQESGAVFTCMTLANT